MKKVPTIFLRDSVERKLVIDEINPVCDWVFKGEGNATIKLDGTCCLIKDGKFYKRCTVKKSHSEPDNFISVDFDENTGKTFGWIPVDPDSKSDQWHMEAFSPLLVDGTYELMGPKIQGNPDGYFAHILYKHGILGTVSDLTDRGFGDLREFLEFKDIEGIVFHHPDGRMGKIKKRDFGFSRN